ncbi:MAG: patatin-like phospholipase family protein [Candidatus Cloacimonadota bacterium]
MRIRLILIVLILVFCGSLASVRLGYAFSGGGARGLAHIGVLKVLEEHGIYPDYISGTSIGALVGSLCAMGYTASEIEELVLSWNWEELLTDEAIRRDVYIGQKRWPPYGNLSLELDDNWKARLSTGIFSANNLNLALAQTYAKASLYEDFAELPIPFSAVATNLETGEETVFRTGSLMQAVRASLSVPSIIKPFEIDGSMYIDGGVSDNYPVAQVRALGADLVLGFKANSELKPVEELSNPVLVIDQTINIGMTRTISQEPDSLLLTLEPYLSEFSARSFSSAQSIILAGEEFARARLPLLLDSLRRQGYVFRDETHPTFRETQNFWLARIRVVGNKYLSRTKILEYVSLETGRQYSLDQIIQRCKFAWNSGYFVTIYPVLIPEEGHHILEIHVEEHKRKNITLNLSYKSEDLLHASSVLGMNNYILKNSRFLMELRVGNNNELNLDYVKNFGELYGIYYRLFSYINERSNYIYDDAHHKTDSVRRLEYGASLGMGMFLNDVLNFETYLYNYKADLYRDVSQTAPLQRHFNIGGYGLKVYHESLDDYDQPTSGLSLMAKFSSARDRLISDYDFNKFWLEMDFYRPVSRSFNLRFGLDYGSYFSTGVGSQLDPYYLGGDDGFMAYEKYELSAPFYKIFTFGISCNSFDRFQISTGLQALIHSDIDDWSLNQETENCLYASVTYKTILGPLQASLAFPQDNRPKFYLNLGYTHDLFRFSRR